MNNDLKQSLTDFNNSNLGKTAFPTDEDLKLIQNFKKRKIVKEIKLYSFILFMLILCLPVFFSSWQEAKLINKIFGIIIYLLFIFIENSLIIEIFQLEKANLKYFNYGIIVDKYYSYHHSKNVKPNISAAGEGRTPHIIVLKDDKRLNINSCSIDDYRSIKINDEVLIFMFEDIFLFDDKKSIYICKRN